MSVAVLLKLDVWVWKKEALGGLAEEEQVCELVSHQLCLS